MQAAATAILSRCRLRPLRCDDNMAVRRQWDRIVRPVRGRQGVV